MAGLRSLPTKYKGFSFRSRLEARYAALFDALGLVWEYEHQIYDCDSAGGYLPDFWLPQLKCFVEIKGEWPTEEELAKIQSLSLFSGFPVWLAIGTPGYRSLLARVAPAPWVETVRPEVVQRAVTEARSASFGAPPPTPTPAFPTPVRMATTLDDDQSMIATTIARQRARDARTLPEA